MKWALFIASLFLVFIPSLDAQVYPQPLSVGLIANRPTFCANTGQFYYATDTAVLYDSTVAGTSCTWTAIASSSGPTGNAGGVLSGTYPNPGIAVAGVIAQKPATSDTILYVSNNGSDSNDGLSWGTAKLTVDGACAALPGGNNMCSAGTGLIHISPNFSGTLSTTVATGIQLVQMGAANCGQNFPGMCVSSTTATTQIWLFSDNQANGVSLTTDGNGGPAVQGESAANTIDIEPADLTGTWGWARFLSASDSITIEGYSTDTNTSLTLGCKGTCGVNAPTPVSTDNSTKIATTAYVQNVTANYFYVSEQVSRTNATTAAPAQNATKLYSIYVTNPVSSLVVGHLVFDVTTADASSDLYDFGLYGPGCNSGATNVPLVAHIGATTGNTIGTGVQNLALTAAVNMTPGWYCFAITSSTAVPTIIMGGSTLSTNLALFANGSSPGGSTGTTSGGVLNSTITAPTLGAQVVAWPYVGLF